MENLNIPYFRNLLSTNVNNLKGLCKEWEALVADSSIPEDVLDEIRTTVGLTNLLLRQKLKQFHGLIDDSEFKRGEREITCLDLQGFWDMVYSEVEKIQKSFQKLKKCQENSWKFIEEPVSKIETKKKTFPSVVKTVVTSKNHASAARQRLAEAKLKMKAQMASCKTEGKIEAELNKNIGLTYSEKFIESKKEKQNFEESSVANNAISNITNIQVSQQKQFEKSNSKTRGHNKNTENLDKENITLATGSDNKSIGLKGRKVKEIIPLQCVTRSAKKAMLIKQTGS